MAISSEESDHTSTTESHLEESIPESSQTEDATGDLTLAEPQEQDKEKQAQEELHIYQDKYMRLAAEFENYKRRAQRDQSDAIRYANESLLKNLLSTIDSLERAIQCGKDAGSSGALLEGIELTLKQFMEIVGKLGVRQISSTGSFFDPTIHQAVAQVESETAEVNTIVEEFQKGYFLYDRILRPAMVTVAKEKSVQTETISTQDIGEEGGIHA